ncbi:hypothetical protein GC177_05295 [bacterium]|nr:hypothetical protein [bacterium]
MARKATSRAASKKPVTVTIAPDERVWWVSRLKGVVERCMQAETVMDRKGEWTGLYQFDASAALKGLEMLGKHYGLLQPVAGGDGALLVEEDRLDDEIARLIKECGYAVAGESTVTGMPAEKMGA